MNVKQLRQALEELEDEHGEKEVRVDNPPGQPFVLHPDVGPEYVWLDI